jgi:putative ABC transport system substrate-binding protein
MRRRAFIAGAASAVMAGGVAARPARAQRRASPVRLGYLTGGGPSEVNFANLRLGLQRLGWIEDRDFTLRVRYAELDFARFPALVDELLREGIDILVTAGPAARVIPIAQHAVPVVFAFSGDPVVAGLVQSFARPGGNATGVSQLSLELAGKRLEVLREAAPSSRRTFTLQSPFHPGEREERRVTQVSADRLGLEIVVREVRDRAEVMAALAESDSAGCDSIACFPDPVTLANRDAIAEHALRRRLPSVFGRREFCDAGGLVSYGPNIAEVYARLAYFVMRIAGGSRAGDLPVELPTVIETVVNVKTARAIGVAMPPSLLLRADEVIE